MTMNRRDVIKGAIAASAVAVIPKQSEGYISDVEVTPHAKYGDTSVKLEGRPLADLYINGKPAENIAGMRLEVPPYRDGLMLRRLSIDFHGPVGNEIFGATYNGTKVHIAIPEFRLGSWFVPISLDMQHGSNDSTLHLVEYYRG